PTVSATVPANAATGAAINGKIAVTFSEAMDPTTITKATFALKLGSNPKEDQGSKPKEDEDEGDGRSRRHDGAGEKVAGTVSYAGVTAIFTPAGTLAPNTTYTATLTTGARDLAGNALASNFVWSFTTGATPDTTAPIVSFTVPANAATGVAISQKIAATFSKAMDPLTITPVTFRSEERRVAKAGTARYAADTATINQLSTIAPNSTYTATP